MAKQQIRLKIVFIIEQNCFLIIKIVIRRPNDGFRRKKSGFKQNLVGDSKAA